MYRSGTRERDFERSRRNKEEVGGFALADLGQSFHYFSGRDYFVTGVPKQFRQAAIFLTLPSPEVLANQQFNWRISLVSVEYARRFGGGNSKTPKPGSCVKFWPNSSRPFPGTLAAVSLVARCPQASRLCATVATWIHRPALSAATERCAREHHRNFDQNCHLRNSHRTIWISNQPYRAIRNIDRWLCCYWCIGWRCVVCCSTRVCWDSCS